MENRILEILEDILPENDYTSSDNFIDDGLLDSFDITMVIKKLETEYNIKIKISEISANDFININTIVELVNKYLNK